jgi:hypothetical protein
VEIKEIDGGSEFNDKNIKKKKRLRQEDHEFEASLDYIQIQCHHLLKNNNAWDVPQW